MKGSSVNVLLFAAGLGTRLKPATDKHPKPCLPLLGIPLGYYALPYIQHLNVSHFVVNTFHLPEQIHSLYFNANPETQFSNEYSFIKGSGGGLKQASKYFDPLDPILTMNADEVFFTNEQNFLSRALEQHLRDDALATLVVTEHPEAGKKFGAIWCDGNKIIAIGKDKPSRPAKPWHFIGTQFFSQRILNLIPDGIETNIFYDVLVNHLNRTGLMIYPIRCEWFETGNIQDYTDTKKIITAKMSADPVYKQHMSELQKYPKSNLSDLA